MSAFVLDIKRLYLPGTVIRSPCAKCGREATSDLEVDHLSYPPVGELAHMLYCETCRMSWIVMIRLVVRVEAVEGCVVEPAAGGGR